MYCHVCTSCISGYALVYFAVQYCVLYSSTVSSSQDVQKLSAATDTPGPAKKRFIHQWIIFSRGWIELNPSKNQNLCHQWQTWAKLQVTCHFLCWRAFIPTISHFLALLQSVTLLACILDASPCVPAIVLDYSTFQGTETFKIFSWFFSCFF